MVASNFSTQSLALLFTFAFQVHGEVIVQSDNVTFPGYADLPALFGPGLPAGDERLFGVLKAADPLDACAPLRPPENPLPEGVGWVALISRSHNEKDAEHNCSFVDKVIRAEDAGAIAAIVFDDQEESLRRMAPAPWNKREPKIPSVFVSLLSGLQMQKIIQLSSQPDVDPLVFFLSGNALRWISIFTSTTVGLLAVGTVMVLFVFAKYQHRATFGFPPGGLDDGLEDEDDLEGNPGGRRRRRGKTVLNKEELDLLPKMVHRSATTHCGGKKRQKMKKTQDPEDDEKDLEKDEGIVVDVAAALGEGEGEVLVDVCGEGPQGIASSSKLIGEEKKDQACDCEEDSLSGSEGEEVGSGDVDVCAVCIEEYVEGDWLRELPCGHRFHAACIDEWLTKMQATCPLCKLDVKQALRERLAKAEAEAEAANACNVEQSEAEASAECTEDTPLLASRAQSV